MHFHLVFCVVEQTILYFQSRIWGRWTFRQIKSVLNGLTQCQKHICRDCATKAFLTRNVIKIMADDEQVMKY